MQEIWNNLMTERTMAGVLIIGSIFLVFGLAKYFEIREFRLKQKIKQKNKEELSPCPLCQARKELQELKEQQEMQKLPPFFM